MDKMPLLLFATLLMTALSGCSDSGDGGPATPACDTAMNYVDANGDCQAHVEPHMGIDLPESAAQYATTQFSWSLNNGTRGTSDNPVHSMDNRVVAVVDGTIPTNLTDPRDETVGVELALMEHQNLPQNFTGSFKWNTAETITIWGYMRIDGIHIWDNLGDLIVLAPKPTGQEVSFTVSQGPPPALAADTANGAVGDKVTFVNDNALFGYTVAFDGTGCNDLPDLAVGAGSSASTPAILEPMTCQFTMKTQASPTITNGDLAGQFTLNTP